MKEALRFDKCIELGSLRETRVYKKLRPFIFNKISQYSHIEGNTITNKVEIDLSVADRFIVSIDIIFGDIFENVRARQFIRYSLEMHLKEASFSPIVINCYHRWYIHEMVILFDRLERVLGLLELAYGSDPDITILETKLLSVYPPLLHEKRNYNQHRLYLNVPGKNRPTSYVASNEEYKKNYKLYRDGLNKVLSMCVDAEEKFSLFLNAFFEGIYDFIWIENRLRDPVCLGKEFSIGQRINRRERLRDKHEEIFKEYNP